MKLGIISDIHSNSTALKTVLEYMEKAGCEEYLLLGDYVSDTAGARETMALLRELMNKYPCRVLRGNREDYMWVQRRVRRGLEPGNLWLRNSASGNLLFTYEQLSEEDIDWFESLPITFVYEKEGYPSITCCHGSVDNTRTLLQLDSAEAKAVLDSLNTEYFLAAHTHNQGVMHYNGRTYINPGSLGISIGAPGLAQCAILTPAEKDGKVYWEPELLNIPYDVDAVLTDIFRSGLYDSAHWFLNNNIHILLTGIDLTPDLVNLAMELQAKETDKEAVWPFIEECYFDKAGALLRIPDYAYLRGKYK